jgi:Ser/Thr protein kinase RdoA (MazF antagonist)
VSGQSQDPARWLFVALDALGIEASPVMPLVAPVAWSHTPRAYLVSTHDGRRVKVRRSRREDLARRAAVLSDRLGDRRVPPPLARAGRFTAELWVEGSPLSSLRLGGGHVDDAADLLASIHRFSGVTRQDQPLRPGPPRLPMLPRLQRTAPILRRAEAQLVEVTRAARITSLEARHLGKILRNGLPISASWGLTHGDFCGDNLVFRPDGTLASVDNELLGHGFLEYDLARAWYRWPMPRWAGERFEGTYRSTVGVGKPAPEEQRAWRVAATLKGFHLRHRRGVSSERGLTLLRLLLEP